MTDPIIQACQVQLSRADWECHIKSWKHSRLSKAEYCRRRRISYHAFNYWQRRLKKSKGDSSITLVKLEGLDKMKTSFQEPPAFSRSPISFWLKDFCIEVWDDFSRVSLVKLIETLRRI